MRIDRRIFVGLPSVILMLELVNNLSKRLSRRMAVVLVFAFASSSFALHMGPPGGKKHENRREIEQIEEAWRNAVLKSNSAALSPLLADDYMAITATGTLETKERTLANLRSGAMHFTSIDLSERKLRFYGSTALVTSRAEVSGTVANHDVSGSYRYTHVYVRDAQGNWKIVSFEASRIRYPGKRR